MTQNQAMHVRTENVLKTRSLEGKIPNGQDSSSVRDILSLVSKDAAV